MSLTDFLLRRIAEERAWYESRGGFCTCPMNSPRWSIASHRPGCPKRVLAECEARRRIIALHAQVADPEGDRGADLCAVCSANGPEAQGWPCETLRLLALPYAEHPDYDEAWRP